MGSFFLCTHSQGNKKCAKFPALAESLQKVHVFVVVVGGGGATSQPTNHNNNNIQSNLLKLLDCATRRLGFATPPSLFVCWALPPKDYGIRSNFWKFLPS